MSAEVLTCSSTPNLKKLEVLIRPSEGGRHEPNLDWQAAEVQVRVDDRNLPPERAQESQKAVDYKTVFPSTGSINFNSDYEQHIDRLHAQFGIKKGQRFSHDPVLERVRFEKAKTDQERQTVRLGIIDNIGKTLYERAHSQVSTIIYYQDEKGQIFAPNFDEPVDVVLQRGVEYSKAQEFVDYKREVEEFEGWKEAMTVLFNPETPIKSKAIFISEAGKVEGTSFTDNFVDILQNVFDPDTGRVMVIQTRFASEIKEDEYIKTASRLDRHYFNKGQLVTGEEDIYFKRHHIFIDATQDARNPNQLFAEEFRTQKQATAEEKIKGYLEECKLCILYYADTICDKFFQVDKVKEAFRTVVNKFDSLRKGLIEVARNVVNKVSNWVDKANNYVMQVAEDIIRYGRTKVVEMMVGCGLSADFSDGEVSSGILGKAKRLIAKIGRRIAKFLGFGRRSKWFVCPECDYEATGPVGNSCPGCGLTKEAYARVGGKTC